MEVAKETKFGTKVV